MGKLKEEITFIKEEIRLAEAQKALKELEFAKERARAFEAFTRCYTKEGRDAFKEIYKSNPQIAELYSSRIGAAIGGIYGMYKGTSIGKDASERTWSGIIDCGIGILLGNFWGAGTTAALCTGLEAISVVAQHKQNNAEKGNK